MTVGAGYAQTPQGLFSATAGADQAQKPVGASAMDTPAYLYEGNAVAKSLSQATEPIRAQVVPRTGSRAYLLALSGNAQEVSSATDTPSLIKHSGVAGGAVAFDTFGAVKEDTIDNTYSSYTVPAWPQIMYLYVNTTPGDVTTTINFANGYKVGQKLHFIVATDSAHVMTLTPGATCPIIGGGTFTTNKEYVYSWNGTAWGMCELRDTTQGGFSIAGGQAPADGVAIGRGAFLITDGAVPSIALAAGAGEGITIGSEGEFAYEVGRKSQKIENSLFVTTAQSGTAAELTLDGAAASSSNRFTFSLTEARVKLRVTILGQIGTGIDVWSNTYEAILDLSTTGTVQNITAVAAGTAILGTGTLAGSPPSAVAVAIVSNKLSVKVTPASATSTRWWAHVECIKFMN